MNSPKLSLALGLFSAIVSLGCAGSAVRAEDLVGTWQLVSVKDLKTGKVDDVEAHQVLWLQCTKSHWTYLWMDLDRKVITPDELEKLPHDRRIEENYAKIWDANDVHRFWGAGGKYRIEGNRFVYTNDVSIEPYMLARTGVEIIARLDSTTYVRRSVNPAGEVVRESIFRRIG